MLKANVLWKKGQWLIVETSVFSDWPRGLIENWEDPWSITANKKLMACETNF